MASTGWGWGGLRASWRCGRATTSESKQLLPGPPCSPSWFFLCCWFSDLGDAVQGLSPVPQVPHKSQLGLPAMPRLLPKPVGGAACTLPCPHCHTPKQGVRAPR